MATLRYSSSGYCSGCGETIAESDGDSVRDFEESLVERSEWVFKRHLEEEHPNG